MDRRTPRNLLFPVLACAFGAALPAQIGSLTLPAGTGDDPRGVHVIANNHVVISNQIDGWQHFVNVTTPTAPALTNSYNPPYGDQWFEAEYTPLLGGRLFTAHRGGGINLIDVSNPSAPATLSSVPTAYHFRGLRYMRDGANGVLFYNETNAGLGVFTVTANASVLSSTPVWNNYVSNGTNDGNGLEVIGNQLYQFGTPPNNQAQRLFKGFNVSTPQAPVLNFSGSFSNQTVPNGHTQLRRSQIPLAPRIIASRWNDGIDVIDTTVPTAPVTYPIIAPLPNLTILCWGATPFPNSPFAIAYGAVWATSNPSLKFYWWMVLIVPPSGPPTMAGLLPSPIDTHDIAVDPNTNRVYVVGRNALGQGVLQIY